MKFINANIPDKLCFLSNSQAVKLKLNCFDYEHAEFEPITLVDFINLRHRDYKQSLLIEDIDSFAYKYGSLTDNVDLMGMINVPAGFSCAQTQNFSLKREIDRLYYETYNYWFSHIDAFYDLACLSYFRKYPSRHEYHTMIRSLAQNLIFFEDKKENCYYCFKGSAPIENSSNYEEFTKLPKSIQSFIEQWGHPYLFSALAKTEVDTLDARIKWLEKHINYIFETYIDRYMELQGVSEGYLLGKLQRQLKIALNNSKPLSICLLCGNVFYPTDRNVKSAHFCSSMCMGRFYPKKDTYIGELVSKTAFNEEDFAVLFNTKNRKF